MDASRRQFLGVLGAAGGTGLAGCTDLDVTVDQAQTPTGTETEMDTRSWPTFQRDNRNSGHAATTGPADDASQQWRAAELLADDQRIAVGSPPAVVEDTVYAGSWDGGVYALSATDGSVRWRYDAGDTAYAAPAVADGTVFVGYRGPLLYALSAADGTERWRAHTGHGSTAPAVVDDTVYVGGDDAVYALATTDGAERWVFETGDVETAPAVVDDTVYVGTGLYTVPPPPDCEKGRGCRDEPRPGSPHSHSVTALSAADGSVRWRYDAGAPVRSSPAVVDGTVFVGSADGRVHALSAVDGSERWTFDTAGRVRSSPAVADGVVYVGAADGTVYALSAADGAERWRSETQGRDILSPVAAGDAVYVVSRVAPPTQGPMANAYVSALSAADGGERWLFKAARPMPSPAVVDGVVHLGPLALE